MEKRKSKSVHQPEASEYSTWVRTEVSYFAQSVSSAGIPSQLDFPTVPLFGYSQVCESEFQREIGLYIIQIYTNDKVIYVV
jgi:hypothetical protein